MIRCWVFMFLLLGSACNHKDDSALVCPNRQGTPCPKEREQKYECDECEQAWACYTTNQQLVWNYTDYECYCFDEKGNVDHELCEDEY